MRLVPTYQCDMKEKKRAGKGPEDKGKERREEERKSIQCPTTININFNGWRRALRDGLFLCPSRKIL
jgi:hypothetical protein